MFISNGFRDGSGVPEWRYGEPEEDNKLAAVRATQPTPAVSVEQAQKLAHCWHCDQGIEIKLLDENGVDCSITRKPGSLSHAVDDSWGPCPRVEQILASVRTAAKQEAERLLHRCYTVMEVRDVCDFKDLDGMGNPMWDAGRMAIWNDLKADLRAALATSAPESTQGTPHGHANDS